MQIAQHQVIGLVGLSGSGKSTLIDVILGLIKPLSGTIEYGGKDIHINHNSIKAYMSDIKHVPQSIFALNDTILNNITFNWSGETVDIAKVKLATKSACIHNYICSLPLELSTIIDERG